MDSVTVEILPDTRLSKNGLRKSNWRVSQGLSKKAREDAYILGLVERGESWVTPEKVSISIVQFHARRPLDFDGLACVCAPTIDGLVDAGILFADDPSHVVSYSMSHQKVKTVAENRVAVTVTPVSAGER